jgi:ribosome biogenesis GTPase
VSASLARWGWRAEMTRALAAGEEPARVVAEYRGGYVVVAEAGELKAGSSGKLRRAIKVEGADKPCVGDWVAISARPEEGTALLHRVLARSTCVRRRAAGGEGAQVVAANVDVVMIVSALTGDVNARRLERYLAVVRESGARPVIVLTKVDLVEDAAGARAAVEAAAGDAPIVVVDALGGRGVEALDAWFAGDATVALVGSSGVGKSTLINRWLGEDRLATRPVRDDGRGRHTTTHRELYLRPAGGLVMDTPGMRELGLVDVDAGLKDTFADVAEVAASCRFRDCRHAGEPGCAVAAALEAGTASAERVAAWQKLRAELDESAGDAEADRKRRGRTGSRAMKRFQKDRGRK